MKHDEYPGGMFKQGCAFWLAAFAACAVYNVYTRLRYVVYHKFGKLNVKKGI